MSAKHTTSRLFTCLSTSISQTLHCSRNFQPTYSAASIQISDASPARRHVYLSVCLHHFISQSFASTPVAETAKKKTSCSAISVYILCSQQQIPDVPSAYLPARVISQKLATTPVTETARKTPNLRLENSKIVNASNDINVECSIPDIVNSLQSYGSITSKTRKPANASDRLNVKCNPLAKIRKPINASDSLNVRCSIPGTANPLVRPTASALDAAF